MNLKFDFNNKERRELSKKLLTKSVTFDDVTLVPSVLTKVSSRNDVNPLTTIKDLQGKPFTFFPVMGASMEFMKQAVAIGLSNAGAVHILPRVGLSQKERLDLASYLVDEKVNFGVAVGLKDRGEFLKELISLRDLGVLKFISLDIAHGASIASVDYMEEARSYGVTNGLIVGNVGSPEGALFLSDAAAMLKYESIIIKVGVGPGAACTTRVKTGVGVGQYSAVNSVARALQEWPWGSSSYAKEHTYIIADGGIEKPADFIKALVAGADAVMMGRYLVSKEFDGKFLGYGDNLEFVYYGMASEKAKAGDDSYVEGAILTIPVKFKSIKEAVDSLEYGLRSAMTYTNSIDLNDLHQATVIENSLAAVHEGRPRGGSNNQ